MRDNRALRALRTAKSAVGEAVETARRARRMAYEHRPHPPAHGLVLDVGSGDAPHPRADCVVDRYVIDDFERGSELSLAKPLVVADGHALPFVDDAFSYVIASHVLEHATDPNQFADQLSRVGETGFVQVPSRAAELTFGWRFHPWLVDRDGDTLVFNPRGEQRAPIGQTFHQAMADSRLLSFWFAANRSLWHHSVHWSDRLSVETTGESAAETTAQLDVERTIAALERLHADGRVRGPRGDLALALRCPADGGELDVATDRVSCERCGHSYPVAGTVPIMLAEATSG